MPKAIHITRRGALTLIGVTASGLLVPRAIFAQQAGGTGSALIAGEVCVLTPEVTEGPYYFDPALERRDITEGKPGAPLTYRLQVVDAMCEPIEGARVDIWHCDALGLYSGYNNQTESGSVSAVGETFLRGTQFADANGVVEFESIYPGWYPGRTVHAHFKVFLDTRNVLTGQIFFPEDLNDRVYATRQPYAQRTTRRTTLNSNDGIAQQAGAASVATTSEAEEAFLAALVIGVNPAATSSGAAGPGRAGGPPGGAGGPPPGFGG